jgi:hypothetical protein
MGTNDQGRAFEHLGSFRVETYRDVKKLACKVQGHIAQRLNIRGRNVRGGLILVPTFGCLNASNFMGPN